MTHFKLLDENIFRNLPLCQNIEQLELVGCFLTYESLHSISQLPNLKTLKSEMITYDVLKIANWLDRPPVFLCPEASLFVSSCVDASAVWGVVA